MTTLIVIWALAVVVATIVGGRKGRRGAGFALGLFLSWIGVVIIAVMPPTHDMLVLREEERLQVQREARGGLG